MSEPLFTDHRRRFQANRFVYPVLSRRSGGISVGVNLNPDKVCNFDCIYCQVDRRTESDQRFVEQQQLLEELDETLQLCATGEIFRVDRFRDVPPAMRRLNDMAFSGDGEPTTYRNFDELMQLSADVKKRHALDGVKMVLITNASQFHREHVRRGLKILDANNGEIWAKLDAGTESYFKLVDRTKISFQLVLDNILAAAQSRPLVIQSLFMRVNGEGPTEAEIDAYINRLNHIADNRGVIQHVQVYTVARQPAESYVTSLANEEVDAITARVVAETPLSATSYYGSSD